jgi:23S rRNA pseudouridine2605 synthase
MRLNKYLASCGVASRRGSDALIAAGRVRLNGTTVTLLATFVSPGDRVTVDGEPVSPPSRHTTVLLHKPEGVVTTVRDPGGRMTVLDLLPPRPRVFPVGRLDRDTSGALLLTDDGDLAHHVLHPRYGVDKEYVALVQGTPADEALEVLRTGVLLPDETRPTAPAVVTVERLTSRTARLRLIVHEGRNRQVRRMLEAVGHPVLSLRRERIGPLSLGTLAPGEWRVLTPEEVAALRGAAGRPRNTGHGRPDRRAPAPRGGTPPEST